MSFEVTTTTGVHSGGTKFYEIVMIYNVTSGKGVVFQRNGGIAVKDLPGKGQIRLMGSGSLYTVGELFRQKAKGKSEYRFDTPMTLSTDAQGVADILSAYSFGSTAAAIIRGNIDLGGSEDQLATNSLLIEEEVPVPKVIPSHYGGW